MEANESYVEIDHNNLTYEVECKVETWNGGLRKNYYVVGIYNPDDTHIQYVKSTKVSPKTPPITTYYTREQSLVLHFRDMITAEENISIMKTAEQKFLKQEAT